MTPGLAVLEASGLSARRFAAITRCSTDRGVIAATKPETIANVWLPKLVEAGINLVVRCELTIAAEGVEWRCHVER